MDFVFNQNDLFVSLPEIFLLTMAGLVLVIELFMEDRGLSSAYGLSQVTLVAAIAVAIWAHPAETTYAYSSTYVADAMGTVSKVFVYIIAALGFLYSKDYLKERGLYKGEFFVLCLFGVLGMTIMISAHHFLTLYLGLELLALSLYALVAFNRESTMASEAAMKYFVLGAIASGMLLYGMSMLYGATGSLDLEVVSAAIVEFQGSKVVLAFGLAFIVVGLAFKFGAVPFHMWVPDVYQGAPTPVVLFIGSAPKIAAFVLVMRLLVEGLSELFAHWQDMLIFLAVASIAIGNLVAIAQTNIKRMLAYSTISHVGFIMMGFIAGTTEGYSSAMFYAITYALTAAAAFGMILLLSRSGFEAEELTDLRGLNKRSPWFAFMMLLIMFSLAGVPPLVGFYAKFAVLKAVVAQEMVWLAIVAVVFSVIGAFYYLRVLKIMYFDDDADSDSTELVRGLDVKVALSLNSLLVLALGLFPGTLLWLCTIAIT